MEALACQQKKWGSLRGTVARTHPSLSLPLMADSSPSISLKMSLQQLSVERWHENHLGCLLKCRCEGPPPVLVNSIILQQVSEFATLGHFPGYALKVIADIKESFSKAIPPLQLPTRCPSSRHISSQLAHPHASLTLFPLQLLTCHPALLHCACDNHAHLWL